MNPKEEDGEDSLFGESSGMNLSKQLFSEQIAVAMSKAGGIGIANQIADQIQGRAKSLNANSASAIAARFKGSLGSAPTSTPSPTSQVIRRGLSRTVNSDLVRSESKISSAMYPEARIISEAVRSSSDINGKDLVRPRVVGLQTEKRGPVQVNLPTSPGRIDSAVSLPVNLRMPVKGTISSHFGERRDPINGRLRFHEGVDIAAPKGTPIAAAAAGKVIFAGPNRGYGKVVLIQHADGRVTRYAHAGKIIVSEGESVEAGQTIATVGSTGHSTGPHLHFEVMEDGRHINPLKALANDFTLARR